jgi:hypothetical protein
MAFVPRLKNILTPYICVYVQVVNFVALNWIVTVLRICSFALSITTTGYISHVGLNGLNGNVVKSTWYLLDSWRLTC